MEFLWQALRQVVFLLDQVAYGLIPSAYELIFYLANVNLFNNNGALSALINRVYLLLGIFMLFKVAFSLIQYMIDPNTFNDKSKGFGKLVTNTLVAIVLLVMTPFIFEQAYDFQGKIVLSNVIPRLILGDESYNDYSGENAVDMGNIEERQSLIHSMGVDVQFTMFSAFFTLNTDDDTSGYPNCRPDSSAPLKNVLGSSDMLNDAGCWDSVKDDLTNELHKQGGTLRGMFKYNGSQTSTNDSCPNNVCDERDFSTFGKLLWWMKGGGNSAFTITYIPIISALVGGYLLLLLITFSIDIATRVFKLLFLQMVAPIAIISYMDPKESVGSGKFHNWLVECGKTYCSLFLRLAVIYAAMQLVRVILFSMFGITGDSSSMYYKGIAPNDTLNIFVYIFLVLGIFTFAKKVPQMIEGIFGIKMSGELNLNPFKTFKEIGSNPLVAGGIGALGGAAGAMAANTIAAGKGFGQWVKDGGIDKVGQNLNAIRQNGGNAMALTGSNFRNAMQGRMSVRDAFKYSGRAFNVARKDAAAAMKPTGFAKQAENIAGIAAGGVSGAARGAAQGAKTKDGVKAADSARQAIIKARNDRDVRQKNDYGIVQRASDKVSTFAGVKNKAAGIGMYDQKVKELTREKENLELRERSFRQAQADFVAKSNYTTQQLDDAIYRRNADGTRSDQLIDINTYTGSIDRDTLQKYHSMAQDIASFDQQQEEIRRQLSDLNSVMNQAKSSGDKK